MELKYDNIHEYTIKCSNTTQITLDDDYNVPDSKTDIDSIIKDFGLVVTDGVRVNQDKAQVEGNLKYAVLYIGKGQEGGRLIPVRLDGSLHFVENVNLSCDAADTDVAAHFFHILFELCPERRIFNTVNIPLKSKLCGIRCHTAASRPKM